MVLAIVVVRQRPRVAGRARNGRHNNHTLILNVGKNARPSVAKLILELRSKTNMENVWIRISVTEMEDTCTCGVAM